MNRSRLITAVAVAAALSLAACSNSGTPEGASTPAASTPATSQQPPAAGSAAGSSTAAGEASGDSAATSDSAGASSETGGDSGGAAGDGSSGQATDQTTVTVGGGGLDTQSAAWFSTFCEGMAPLADLDDTMASVDPNDPQKMRDSYVAYFNTLGDAMIDTSNRLKSTPPPTFDKGPEIAGKITVALGKAGPEIKQSANKLASAEVTDADSLTEAMESASQTMNSEMADLSLEGYELDPQTQKAVESLPACQALDEAFGG